MKVIYILATMLLLIISTTNLNAQDWDSFNERERKIYLLGWYGTLWTSNSKISEFIISIYEISDSKLTDVCSIFFSVTFQSVQDSLETYNFDDGDLDSLIQSIDKTLLLNKKRQEILRGALKYFKHGQKEFGHIVEFQPIFDGLKLSEGIIKTNKNLEKIYIDDATEVALRMWGNRNKHTYSPMLIRRWTELDNKEKGIYIDGWQDGSFFIQKLVVNASLHFVLEYPSCIVDITRGLLELSERIRISQPDFLRFYEEKDSLILRINEYVVNNGKEEKSIFISVLAGIKIWNSESEE
ncbi:MAG: hypothetical protein IIB94_06430 [Candidatus Marinimicrobia bacterium]|nr:hypothetical protein [Candidatus Neomarinimicrobiota bacterium]